MSEMTEKDKLFKTIRILLIMGVVGLGLYFIINHYQEKQAAKATGEFLYELLKDHLPE